MIKWCGISGDKLLCHTAKWQAVLEVLSHVNVCIGGAPFPLELLVKIRQERLLD